MARQLATAATAVSLTFFHNASTDMTIEINTLLADEDTLPVSN